MPELTGEYGTLMKWADAVRKLKVRANADTPADARAAIRFGAEGIGLCRTEHMFFDANRIGVAGVNNAATLVPLTSTRH